MGTVRGSLSLLWVQDSEVCSSQPAAPVLCSFNRAAGQRAWNQDPRGPSLLLVACSPPKARKRWVSLGCVVMSCPDSPKRQGKGLQPLHEWGLGTAFVLGPRGCQRTWSFQGMLPGTLQPTGKPRKKLVPVEGAEPYARLRSSFYTFAQKVPHDHWKRFGRALNLLENDIALAEKESGLEVLIEMLKKWQEKGTIDTSVNTLLDTLHQISLGGVAEDIAFELVKEESFQYEVS